MFFFFNFRVQRLKDSEKVRNIPFNLRKMVFYRWAVDDYASVKVAWVNVCWTFFFRHTILGIISVKITPKVVSIIIKIQMFFSFFFCWWKKRRKSLMARIADEPRVDCRRPLFSKSKKCEREEEKGVCQREMDVCIWHRIQMCVWWHDLREKKMVSPKC